ncbi:hypothetical protein FB451DRAFT_1468247 [Mycena latifolia]|nr:hypothetical protein FB451DRAFT_1468247 [Mycena latifolia]
MQTSAGTSLVSGIQDISAFLPIIGTDQCEKHVGQALDGGFLYAAATPLSMFGSLGIVKASAAILVASISPRFAQMLADSGFKLEPEGSVTAMIGAPPSKREHDNQYIASQKFLEDQHISKLQLRLKCDYGTWNWQLCISTALLACLSITPYIRIIMNDHSSKGFPTWVPPLLRIVGSAVSVVVAQIIIQFRMQQILNSRFSITQPPALNFGSKTRLHDLEQGTAPSNATPNPGDNSPQATQAPLQPPSESLSSGDGKADAIACKPLNKISSHIHLALLQVLLFCGIVSTAVGYLGCFTVVQNSLAGDTYMWVSLEIALALLRICIWGLNPTWDEQHGFSLELQLPDDFEKAPTITTAQDFRGRILGKHDSEPGPFMVMTDSRFLEYISPYTGPVERFSDTDHHVALYYALVGSRGSDSSPESKVLLTTVLDLESRDTFVLVHHCPPMGPSTYTPAVYSATLERMQGTGIMTAKCSTLQEIANRIGGIDRVISLHVSWDLESVTPELDKAAKPSESPLTQLDKEYLRMQDLAYRWRSDFDKEQDTHLTCMASAFELQRQPDSNAFLFLAAALEAMWSYECAFFEKYLIAKTTPSALMNQVFYEDARRLEVRHAGEARKESLTRRTDKYREMAGIETFPQNKTLAWVAMDIEDETLDELSQGYCGFAHPPVFERIVDLEMHRMNTRCETWKNIPTASRQYLAEAVFAAYPSSGCANDPELFEIMAARGCTVFDFALDNNDTADSNNTADSKSPMPSTRS